MKSIGTGRRKLEREGGFTLIEVMVVVIVIGVLVAIAIPTLLGARDRANTASAKSRAVQALKTQKTIYADGKGYESSTTRLEDAEPSLDFRTFDEDGGEAARVQGVVYIRDVAPEAVTVVARSDEGICFWARDQGGSTVYGKGGCVDPPTNFSSDWP